MTLVWCDGFDHYGTDETNLLDGVYAQTDGSLSTTQVATGTGAFFVGSIGGLNEFDGLRKVLPSAKDKLGMAARFYWPSLPVSNYQSAFFILMPSNSTDNAQIAFTLGLNGEIHVIRNAKTFGQGSGGFSQEGTVIATTDPIIVAGAYNHIEVQAYIHDTDGWVRIIVNGAYDFEYTSLDTKGSSSTANVGSIAQALAVLASGENAEFYMDDYYIYNFEGDSAVYTDWCPTTDGGTGVATNFMGEWECIYLPPDGDTAEADWAKSTGLIGYQLIDETDPNDADYISSTAAGDLSEFEVTDLPEDITVIRGLQIIGRLSKSDSGPAMIKYGMKSVAAVDDADERPVTVEPTYWWDFINVDPNSSARWTRASLNNAWVRITRSI